MMSVAHGKDQDLRLRAPLRRGFISSNLEPGPLSGTSDSWEASCPRASPPKESRRPRRRTKGLLSPQCGILQKGGGGRGRTTPATAEPQDPLSWVSTDAMKPFSRTNLKLRRPRWLRKSMRPPRTITTDGSQSL
ncbi:hypothetical protein L209DRAFT_798987 [Thermothelomyces heterothallicus CBS 203.75]